MFTGVNVAVFVAVTVGVDVPVGVKVGVLVAVPVGVLVAVLTAVFVGVLVAGQVLTAVPVNDCGVVGFPDASRPSTQMSALLAVLYPRR